MFKSLTSVFLLHVIFSFFRVPGNQAHVDLLFQNFDEDANVDFDSLDIAVNAVATAVKDFFFKVLLKLYYHCTLHLANI